MFNGEIGARLRDLSCEATLGNRLASRSPNLLHKREAIKIRAAEARAQEGFGAAQARAQEGLRAAQAKGPHLCMCFGLGALGAWGARGLAQIRQAPGVGGAVSEQV